MAIFNFQKPDKVIMTDSTDFEGIKILDLVNHRYGLTIGNAQKSFFQH
jgi:hypothetical protein